MQRFQAIFVIALLLALPLALLTDAGAGAMGMCDGYCCLPHGHHSAKMPSADRQASQEKSPEGMSCHHGAVPHQLNCSMKSNNRGMAYNILAPLGPANLSPSVTLVQPVTLRRAGLEISHDSNSGFLSVPFEPPRA